MSNFGSGSSSNGQFWYGSTTNFPGFLYKKNLGVGGRRSTKMAPGGNTTCNSSTDLYNKYKPGGGGVGASSIANRRAKNRLASVCGSSNKCFPCYNTLGQYSNYTHNPNGFVPCPGTINIISSSGSSPGPSGTYTVTYLGNTNTGGAAPAPTTSYSSGTSVSILGNSGTFTKTGYQFAGWNTAADGTGTNYVGGDAFTINANTTLYANWIIGGVTLFYNAGTGGSGTAPSSSGTNYTAFSTVNVVGNTGSFTNSSGYTFGGWNTAADGSGTSYPAGSKYTMPGAGTVTLYAQWINPATTYTLTYNAGTNGTGTPPAPVTNYSSNTPATILGNIGPYTNSTSPTFYGWNTLANGTGISYPVGSTITMNANKTLYAQWGSPPLLTVTYNANPPSGATTSGAVPAAPTDYPTNVQVPILGQGSLITPGYSFLGWNGSPTGAGSLYAPGYTFTSKTASLYAQWAPGSTVKNCGGGTGGNNFIFYNYPFAQIIKSTNTITIYTTCIMGSTSSNVGSGAAPEGLISITSKMVITSATITINTNTTYLNSANDYNYAYTITNGSGVTYWPSGATISTVTFPFPPPFPANSPAGTATYSISTRGCVSGCGLSGTGSTNGAIFTSFNFFNQGVTLNYSNGTNTIFVSSPNNSIYSTTAKNSTPTFIQTPSSLYPYSLITPRSSAALTTITIIPSTASEYIYPPMPNYTVEYNGNGATGGNIPVPTYFAPYTGTSFPYTVLGNPVLTPLTKTGFTFNGWNTAANGSGTSYAGGASYAGGSNIILYAQWV